MKIKIPMVNQKTKEETFQEVEAQKITKNLYVHKVEKEFHIYAGEVTVTRYWKITAMPCGYLVWTAKTKKQAIEIAKRIKDFNFGRSIEEMRADKTVQKVFDILKEYKSDECQMFTRKKH